MTDKEKARAYDEALGRAKEWREKYSSIISPDGTMAKDFDSIFSELCESEDERIVRIIENVICTNEGEVIAQKYGLKLTELADWLEKQKENPKSADSIPSDCASDAKYGNSRHKVEDSPEGRRLADEVVAYLIKSGYQPIIKDTLDQKHFQIKIPRHKEDFFHSKEYKHCREILGEYYYEGDFAGDVYTLYVLRQKEQNAEDEEDNDFAIYHPLKNGKGEYECIPYSFYGSLTSFSEDKDLVDFLRTCFYTEEECNEWIEQQKEQKPADLPPGFYFIDLDGKKYYSKEFRFGDMKMKVVEDKSEKPAEWSEEDESCWNLIWDILDGPFAASKESFKKAASWFLQNCPKGTKSLRPSWKPSEEQMAALHAMNCLGELSYQGQQQLLIDLYQQLKKLM